MHDFCFTIPYGLLLLFGGFMGYATKGSIASLAGGGGTGLVLILAGYLSLTSFNNRKNNILASFLQTVLILAGYLSLTAFNNRKNNTLVSFLQTACAIMLTYVMGQRYARTSKIMPAGLVAGISVVMTIFYLYKFATGGNKIPPKTE